MSFLIWHTLAFVASVAIAFAAGYQTANKNTVEMQLEKNK